MHITFTDFPGNIHIPRPTTLSVWYNLPIVGTILRAILLIPVLIVLFFYGLYTAILLLINTFFVFLTGKYSHKAYEAALHVIILNTKINAFLFSMTDIYPGFTFELPEHWKLDVPYQHNPNRLLAVPIGGFIVRLILLFPFFIWANIFSQGSLIATFLQQCVLLFKKGHTNEYLFDFQHDSLRQSIDTAKFMTGLDDRYPTFNFRHTDRNWITYVLLILGAVATFSSTWHEEKRGGDQYNKPDNTIRFQERHNDSDNPYRDS